MAVEASSLGDGAVAPPVYIRLDELDDRRHDLFRVVTEGTVIDIMPDDVDARYCIMFLKDGYKVKVMVTFRGRSIIYKDQGELLLLRFAQSLEEFGKLDQMPTLVGKNMTIMISPKSTKK